VQLAFCRSLGTGRVLEVLSVSKQISHASARSLRSYLERPHASKVGHVLGALVLDLGLDEANRSDFDVEDAFFSLSDFVAQSFCDSGSHLRAGGRK